MKNLKNTISAAALMTVMVFGAVSANAGVILSDKAATTKGECTVKDAGIITQLAGVIISGLSGVILSDAPTPGCDANGVILSDRNGVILSD